MTLDPLGPAREAFIRILDHARLLGEIDPSLPIAVRERATIGLVAVGLQDRPTMLDGVIGIEELLNGSPRALDTDAGRECQAAALAVRALINQLAQTARDTMGSHDGAGPSPQSPAPRAPA